MFKKTLAVAFLIGTMVLLSHYSVGQAAPGVEVYSDGGSYWSQSGSSWGYKSDAGYCYIAGWCTPKYFHYAYNRNDVANTFGTWDNIDYSSTYGRVSVFVPAPDSYSQGVGNYSISYAGGAVASCQINQAGLANAWVACNSSLLGVRNVGLTNYSPYGNPGTKRIAFDEIKLEY